VLNQFATLLHTVVVVPALLVERIGEHGGAHDLAYPCHVHAGLQCGELLLCHHIPLLNVDFVGACGQCQKETEVNDKLLHFSIGQSIITGMIHNGEMSCDQNE